MPKPFYSRTDADLATGAANLVAIVTPAPTTWGLTTAIVTNYTTLSTSYSSALLTATTPATRTSVTVAAKNAARHLLRQASVNVARTITATPTVTNAQLLSLELNERVVPQPRPVPSTPPSVELLSVAARTASCRIHDATSDRRGKPFGATSANVYSFVGPTAPTDPRDFHYEGAATRPKFQIQFPDSVASGATIWISAQWVNARGQTSPASSPICFTLPGGNVLPEAA